MTPAQEIDDPRMNLTNVSTVELWKAYCAKKMRIDELEEQVAALTKDAERLEFLIFYQANVVSDETCCDGFWVTYFHPDGTRWVQTSEHATPREAIDAAIKSQKGTV
jgi:hypothetical protein